MLIDRLEAAYNSIISDYGNDMGYMEYEASYGNYQLNIVVDDDIVMIYGTDCLYEFIIRYSVLEFVNEDYTTFQNRLGQGLYYGSHEVEYLM